MVEGWHDVAVDTEVMVIVVGFAEMVVVIPGLGCH